MTEDDYRIILSQGSHFLRGNTSLTPGFKGESDIPQNETLPPDRPPAPKRPLPANPVEQAKKARAALDVKAWRTPPVELQGIPVTEGARFVEFNEVKSEEGSSQCDGAALAAKIRDAYKKEHRLKLIFTGDYTRNSPRIRYHSSDRSILCHFRARQRNSSNGAESYCCKELEIGRFLLLTPARSPSLIRWDALMAA